MKKNKKKQNGIRKNYHCTVKEHLKIMSDGFEYGETSRKTIYYDNANSLNILEYQEFDKFLSCSSQEYVCELQTYSNKFDLHKSCEVLQIYRYII